MNLRTATTLICLTAAQAFSFGGFSLPPLPSLPAGFPTALPTIPAIPTALPTGLNLQSLIPSAIVELPSAFYESALPDFPTAFPDIPAVFPTLSGGYTIQSRLPYITVPPMPSFDFSTEIPSIPAIPSKLNEAIASRLIDVNNALESAGFSRLPTNPVGAVASLRGALASIQGQLGDGRDGLQKIVDSYMNTTNRNFTVPASEAELRGILEGRGGFNLSRADAILDDLGSKTGQDVRGSVRMIAALILQNSTQPQIFTRATQEFTMHAVKLREGVEQVFNFGTTQMQMPALDLQNKTLSVIQYASNPYQFISGQRLNSQVVSIMIADLAGNETQIRGLADTINFTLPLNVSAAEYKELLGSAAACVYWDDATAAWQTDGCVLIELLPAEARCACNHLTDFAVAAVTPSPSVPIVIAASPSIAPLAASLTATGSAWQTQTATGRPALLVANANAAPEKTSTSLTTIIGASVGTVVAVGAAALIAANWIHYRRKQVAKHVMKPIRTFSPIQRGQSV